MSGFYTYLHCKPDGTPFYVGKGSGNRAWQFSKNRNRHYLNVVAKYGKENIKVFISPCDNEDQAFTEEIRQIEILRECGYELVNRTNGGEGPTGFAHTEEMRKQLSESHKGKRFSDEHKAKIAAALRGRKRPEFSIEWKSKISAALSKRQIKPETRAKLAAASMGNKNGCKRVQQCQ